MKKTKPIGIHLLGGAAWLIGALTASADVVYTNYNLTHLRTEIYNDRIGNSRFFNGPNTDSIRVSTFLRPSPDSNVIGLPCLGNSAIHAIPPMGCRRPYRSLIHHLVRLVNP